MFAEPHDPPQPHLTGNKHYWEAFVSLWSVFVTNHFYCRNKCTVCPEMLQLSLTRCFLSHMILQPRLPGGEIEMSKWIKNQLWVCKSSVQFLIYCVVNNYLKVRLLFVNLFIKAWFFIYTVVSNRLVIFHYCGTKFTCRQIVVNSVLIMKNCSKGGFFCIQRGLFTINMSVDHAIGPIFSIQFSGKKTK